MKHLGRALSYLRHYWLLAAGAFLGLLISSATRLVIPRLTQTIIDDGISAGQMQIVLRAAVATVGLAIAGSVFTFLQGVLSARTAQGVAYDLRNQIPNIKERPSSTSGPLFFLPISNLYFLLPRFLSILAQVSRSATVRLNTSFSADESGSTQK